MIATQPPLFDLREGLRRRDAGQARALSGHALWLEETRIVAVRICKQKGTVCADCLRAAGVEAPEGASPNVFGGVFRDKRFVFDGYTTSERPEAHGNLLRSWRLRG